MIAPAGRFFELVEKLCASCEKHRSAGIVLFAIAMLVGLLGMPAGYTVYFAIFVGTVGGSIAAVGFVSDWRGWVNQD